MVTNKDFGRPRKWILTDQICNAVVLDNFKVKGGRGDFSCEQEWWLVVSVIFVRFWHVGGGCGGVFCRNSLKLRITIQPVMQKARIVENLFLRFITDCILEEH